LEGQWFVNKSLKEEMFLSDSCNSFVDRFAKVLSSGLGIKKERAEPIAIIDSTLSDFVKLPVTYHVGNISDKIVLLWQLLF